MTAKAGVLVVGGEAEGEKEEGNEKRQETGVESGCRAVRGFSFRGFRWMGFPSFVFFFFESLDIGYACCNSASCLNFTIPNTILSTQTPIALHLK